MRPEGGKAHFKEGTRVYVNTPDGRRVGFTFAPKEYDGILTELGGPGAGFYEPYFRPDPGVFETLAGVGDSLGSIDLPLIKVGDAYYIAGLNVAYNPSAYRLTTKDGLAYQFSQFAGLQTITDRNGVTLTFTRDGIFSSLGESITFARDGAGRITAVTDPAGNAFRYEYDQQGNLILTTDQAGQLVHYRYFDDPAHFLKNIASDCGCFPEVKVTYTEDGRIATTGDGEGNVHQASYDLGAMTETDIDPLGNPWVVTYDARGNITSSKSPLGAVSYWTFNENDLPVTFTDARGGVTSQEYDFRGNLVRIEDQEGNFRTYGFNQFNKRDWVVDARGEKTTYAFDAAGRVVSMTDVWRTKLIAQSFPNCRWIDLAA